MLDRLVYLNDNCPPRNQFVLSNCINIINEIYDELRQKYKISKTVRSYEYFKEYLEVNEVEELYMNDLPHVCKSILRTCDIESCPEFLKKRVKKLQEFFGIEQTGYIPFKNMS